MPRHEPVSPLSERDIQQLEARGVSPAEASRQLELLHRPPPAAVLVRPCTLGDGIEAFADEALPALDEAHRAAASRGELGAFVPASGAASRMFRELIVYRDDPRELTLEEIQSDAASGRAEAACLLEFVDFLDRFAFRSDLVPVLDARGESLHVLHTSGPIKPILAALLDADGLGYAGLPKGLIPFHLDADGPRTAFQEHLAEAAELYADDVGRVRVHATVPDERVGPFRDAAARETAGGLQYELTLSVQDAATDTLATDLNGEPFRDERGALVFRPAGHGALLGNLASVSVPVVMIKNIDNVAAEHARGPTLEWTRAIVGRLCQLRERAHARRRRLEEPGDGHATSDALAFARDELGVTDMPDAPTRDAARAILDRPLRVCGMVKNTGEPGGGPFWVRGSDGRVTRQIVESAQVRVDDPEQLAIFRTATHFNPVFLACALDDAHGARHDLARFADESASIVTRRSWGGRELLALERPGLWNGAMAHWNTVFVEVPLTVFNPVKTVNDLLRPEHQPA